MSASDPVRGFFRDEGKRPWRVGRVTDRDAATARVRVRFGDLDDLPTDWWPVLFATTLLNQHYAIPDVDEHVICLVDEHAEFGVVIGAIYSEATAPPIQNLDQSQVKFQDGTTVTYDRAAHKLSIELTSADADVDVTTTGNVTVNVPDGKNVFIGGAAGAEQLATRAFVENIYERHTHPTPAGISGAPIPIGTETAWPQVTQKGVSQ